MFVRLRLKTPVIYSMCLYLLRNNVTFDTCNVRFPINNSQICKNRYFCQFPPTVNVKVLLLVSWYFVRGRLAEMSMRLFTSQLCL